MIMGCGRTGRTCFAMPFFFLESHVNSESELYDGSNLGNGGGVQTNRVSWHDQPFSLLLTFPPLSVVSFKPV